MENKTFTDTEAWKEFVPMYPEKQIYLLQVGDVISGMALKKSKKQHFFDFGGFVPAEECLVIATEFSGGGPNWDGAFPDGHMVTVSNLDINKKYDNDSDTFWFYQSGCFDRLIEEEFIPIRKMELCFK